MNKNSKFPLFIIEFNLDNDVDIFILDQKRWEELILHNYIP